MNIPEGFAARMKELLGEEYEEFLAGYDKPRVYGLRVNTSKISCEEFERICPYSIKKIPWISNGYYYSGEEQPAKHPYYHAGLYYLQEPSAMTPASRLPVYPGEAVLDLCAAPGGKATELGVKLGGSGVLVANDISSSRAKALLKNIELFGIRNPFVVSENPARLVEYFEGYFDKILLDAPCSGEGMFRKDASVMKSYEQNGVDYYAAIQRDILIPAARMLKPGGMMLYSTCTFSPEEDEQAVSFLLDRCPDMELLDMEGYEGFDSGRPEWVNYNIGCTNGGGMTGLMNSTQNNSEYICVQQEVNYYKNISKCVRIWPHRMEGEGHFLALLGKKYYGDDRYHEKDYSDIGIPDRIVSHRRSSGKNKKKNELEYFFSFAEDLDWNIDEDRLELQGERLFYMPEGMQGLKGMRFLRNGLYLGSCLKGRFEPSQALAMAIGRGEYKNSISLSADDERVIRYLKGETIQLTEEEACHKGWNLLCVDGFPLGWGKLGGQTFKNKYHSGWRLV